MFSRKVVGTFRCAVFSRTWSVRTCGEVPVALSADKFESACQAAYDLRDIFGKGNFYIEIQDQGIAEEKRINPH